MHPKTILLATVAAFGLAACGDTDLERGVTGAAAGGLAAEAVGGSFVTGAVIGAGAGVICDDVTPELCDG